MAIEASFLCKPLFIVPPPSPRTARRNPHLVGVRTRWRSAAVAESYVVPFDKAPTLTRPLEEILRDLNKKVPDTIVKNNSISWFHANRMLSFYAPGWCGEIRDIIYSDHGSVTVVYRVTVRGTDGEVHRESTGTVFLSGGRYEDPVAAAEEIAFRKACARFGLGLHLYHENKAVV